MEDRGYMKLTNFSSFTYNIVEKLLDRNETVWKLLKYDSPDALSKQALTEEEKVSLIYQGQALSEPYKIFRTPMTDDGSTKQHSRLYIFPWITDPYQRTNAFQTFMFQIVVHNKIGTLEDGRARADVLLEEIFNALNGELVDGIGRLTFDSNEGRPDYIKQRNWTNNNYYGYELALTTGIA